MLQNREPEPNTKERKNHIYILLTTETPDPGKQTKSIHSIHLKHSRYLSRNPKIYSCFALKSRLICLTVFYFPEIVLNLTLKQGRWIKWPQHSSSKSSTTFPSSLFLSRVLNSKTVLMGSSEWFSEMCLSFYHKNWEEPQRTLHMNDLGSDCHNPCCPFSGVGRT